MVGHSGEGNAPNTIPNTVYSMVGHSGEGNAPNTIHIGRIDAQTYDTNEP